MSISVKQADESIKLIEESLTILDKINDDYGDIDYIREMLDGTRDDLISDLGTVKDEMADAKAGGFLE